MLSRLCNMLMRPTTICLALVAATLASVCPAQQTGTPRQFFAADYHKKIAALVKPDNSVAWSIPIRDIHDAQPLPNGNWLLQTSFTNVIELDKSGKEVWRYDAGKTSDGKQVEIHAFRRLDNGLTMIAESGTTRILEVAQDGTIKHSIPLKVSKPDPHRDTRLVRPTPDGNYLVCHEAENLIREYRRDGSIAWEHNVGSKVYSASRLKNGNTLIGTGDGHSVQEISPDHKIVWQITEKEIPNVRLAWVTMVERLPNGNTWIVNCHGEEQQQILEVTPEKKVVWSFRDFDRFGNALPVAFPQ
jgi:outer membrane protein assembly factor BamB